MRHVTRNLLSSIVAAIVTLSAGPAVWQPASAEPARRTALPAGFVYLRDVDPTIEQGMRYAGYDNFVGHPLPGYDAAECVLRREVAAALKQVQADLAASNLSLKVYDCYRPTRAVQAMAQWAGDGRNSAATKRYFPKLRKENLFALGYIASRSEHSAGTTADLTIVEKDHPPVAAFDRNASYGPCTGPAAQRSPDDSIDMGTGYDCFDVASHTASTAISAEQRRGAKSWSPRWESGDSATTTANGGTTRTGTRGPAGSTIFRSSRAQIDRLSAHSRASGNPALFGARDALRTAVPTYRGDDRRAGIRAHRVS